MDGLPGRIERGGAGARHVLDVDERPPGGAVALKMDDARSHRCTHEVVEHDVEAQSRRDTVGGREAKKDR